jgi:hypothetical protein
LGVTLTLVVLNVVEGRIRLYLVAWLALVVLAFNPMAWGSDFGQEVPRWLWQVILVASALAMAADPLIAAVRDHPRVGSPPILSDRALASAEPLGGSIPA